LDRSGGSEALASRLFPWHPNAHSFHDETGEAHDSGEAAKLKARQIARSLAHEPESYGGYQVGWPLTKASGIACVAVRK
jgi:hypothetical protein